MPKNVASKSYKAGLGWQSPHLIYTLFFHHHHQQRLLVACSGKSWSLEHREYPGDTASNSAEGEKKVFITTTNQQHEF